MAPKKSARQTRPASARRHKSKALPKHRQHIQLDSLIQLNWDESVTLPPQAKIPINVERITLDDRLYRVEALDPTAPCRSCIRLDPKRKYQAVPINDLNLSQRYLLVRQQKALSSQRTFIVVNETTAPDKVGLHILGSPTDKPKRKFDLKPPHIIGVAEAILTPLETTVPAPEPDVASTAEPAEQPQAVNAEEQSTPSEPETLPSMPVDFAVQSPSPASETPSAATAIPPVDPRPVDEELLHNIDALNVIKEHHASVENEIVQVQDGLHSYVQRTFGLEVIPISHHQTTFDAALHEQVAISRYAKIDNGIITSIRQDGYRRPNHPDLFRKARVVVNQHPTQVVKFLQVTHYRPNRLYAELSAPQKKLTDETYREAGIQVGLLDLLYTCLAVYHLADEAALKTLLNHLESNVPLTQALRTELDKEHRWPLRLTSVYRSERWNVQLQGHAVALQALHHILQTEAHQRESARSADPDWPLAELRQLRPNVPLGSKIQEFNALTTQLLTPIRNLLNQMAFAPEFIAEQG